VETGEDCALQEQLPVIAREFRNHLRARGLA
jgi:hypothetical protein